MRIIIEVKNVSERKQQIILLENIIYKYKLPKYIEASVSVINGKETKKCSYYDLINQLDHKPCCVRIFHTTNNRQIDFYTYTNQSLLLGYKYDGKPYMPLEPNLTKNGDARRSKYSIKDDCDRLYPKYDSKKWNIADTKELFILDNKILFELNIKPKQKFRIIIESEQLININPFGKASESIFVLEDIQKYINVPKLKKTKSKK